MAERNDYLETKPCRYGMMSFFKNDSILSRSLRECGEWAQAEIDFLLNFIGTGDTVLDVGAFIGTHTIAFAQKVSDGGKVYAFEPQPAFFEVLTANVKQNSLKNVEVFNAAVSQKSGRTEIEEIDLYDTRNFGGNPIIAAERAAAKAGSRHIIEIITVDQLSLKSCNLIKIDVENMEINALRGARQTLRAARPVVFAECNSLEYGWPVRELLKKEGYDTYILNVQAYNPHNFRSNEKNFLGAGRECGLLLIPKERHSAIQGHLDPVRYPWVIPISNIDDLALALLKKPQYKYEVLSQGKAASVLGVEFWATEPEVKQLQETIQSRESTLAEKLKELQDLSAEKDALARSYHQAAQELQSKSAVLNQICDSHGWKALSIYYRLRDKFFPKDRWRRGVTNPLWRVSKLPRDIWDGVRLLRDMRLIAASGLFDSEWYLKQNPDVARAGVNPLRHYLRRGAKEGRDPNAYFDTDWYLRQNPDVARAGVNPLRHYLRRGAKEGRQPNPYVDSDPHQRQNPDMAKAGASPLLHHSRSDASEGIRKPQSNGHRRTPTLSSPLQIAPFFTAKKGGPHIGIGLVEHFGDIVACEPVVRYLREQTPGAEISWVVREPYRELLDSNPYIDRTIAVECLTDWIKIVAHGVFDRVIDLHVNQRICKHCNVPLSKTVGDVSITGENYFNHGSLLRSFSLAAGLPPREEPPRVYISQDVVEAVDALGLPDKFVVFHCYTNESFKDWNREKWNSLAEYVVKTFRRPVVEVGLKPALDFNFANCINLCGRTSLLEMAEVIKRAALFVGVESGPAHLANAVNTNGIVILGQIPAFQRYNPYTGGYADGSNAILIRNENGPGADIPLDSVQQAVERALRHQNERESRGQNELTASTPGPRSTRSSLPPVPRQEAELAACTIIAKNFLCEARVLAKSFYEHNPGCPFFVLIVDRVDGYFDAEKEPFFVLQADSLDILNAKEMLFKYSVLEASTAVKPFFLEHLLKQHGLRKLIYFDPDILVTNSTAELSKLLDQYSIVLTPHITIPIQDKFHPSEVAILQAGTFNLGFIALRNSELTHRMLTWWKERLQDGCFMAPSQGMHVDQKWMDLVPGLFGDTYVLREPGYNVAYWNLQERHVAVKGGEVTVNGKPSYFFHFSGIDFDNPKVVSRHQNRFCIGDIGDARILLERYRRLVKEAGWRETKSWPYTFDYFESGAKITNVHRELYKTLADAGKKFDNPFGMEFVRWLNESVDGESNPKRVITRLWHHIYKKRPDMKRKYPDLFGEHRDSFIGWIHSTGRVEYLVDASFVPSMGAAQGKRLATKQGSDNRPLIKRVGLA